MIRWYVSVAHMVLTCHGLHPVKFELFSDRWC
jgi:hypothetical protein